VADSSSQILGTANMYVPAMVAEFAGDLARLRTREGMKIAKAKGRLRGKRPKLSLRQETHLVQLLAVRALERVTEQRDDMAHPGSLLPNDRDWSASPEWVVR